MTMRLDYIASMLCTTGGPTTSGANPCHPALGGRGRWLAIAVALIGLLFPASRASAQDLEPRTYAVLPIGLNFLVGGYSYSQGGIATDPSIPLEDAQLHVNGSVLAYARALSVLGRSAKLDLVMPYAWVSGTATFNGEPAKRRVDGFADPSARLSVNLYGGPALTTKEFESFDEDLIIGSSVRLSIPLGQYDSDRLVNIGTHRWAVKPEVGLVKSWGRLQLELASGASVYSSNPDFFGGKHRDQAPIFSQQAHLLLRIGRGIFAAADATYYSGGRTTIDRVKKDDALANARIGGTLSVPVSREFSVKLFGSSGISTRTGSDFDTVGFALQYRWADLEPASELGGPAATPSEPG